MQQHAVKGQQQDNNNFCLKFWIGKVVHAFIKVVDANYRSTRQPQEYQGIGHGLLQARHVLTVMPGLFMTFQQVPDHFGVTGEYQADGNATGQ
ncbi:hypothetical protein D3C81_1800560 [compost metagenome]